ncbi:MAG: hypothetical protein ACTHM8_00085 [Sphingomonas sp.]
MREVRKTIVVAALAVAFLDLEARLPVAHLIDWLSRLSHPALIPT